MISGRRNKSCLPELKSTTLSDQRTPPPASITNPSYPTVGPAPDYFCFFFCFGIFVCEI